MVDWFGYLGVIIIVRVAPKYSKTIGDILHKIFAYYPGTMYFDNTNSKAVNIEHHVDRMNAFITLVFGYIVLSVLYQSSAHMGLNA